MPSADVAMLLSFFSVTYTMLFLFMMELDKMILRFVTHVLLFSISIKNLMSTVCTDCGA